MAADTSADMSPKAPGKFKVVAHLVMAMRRFQASLNPTYHYGKRASDTGGEAPAAAHKIMVQPNTPGGRSTSDRTTSGRTMSGRPIAAGHQHGYKSSLLVRPLAQPSDTELVK